MPATILFVCMAAFDLLQRNMKRLVVQIKKAAGLPAAS